MSDNQITSTVAAAARTIVSAPPGWKVYTAMPDEGRFRVIGSADVIAFELLEKDGTRPICNQVDTSAFGKYDESPPSQFDLQYCLVQPDGRVREFWGSLGQDGVCSFENGTIDCWLKQLSGHYSCCVMTSDEVLEWVNVNKVGIKVYGDGTLSINHEYMTGRFDEPEAHTEFFDASAALSFHNKEIAGKLIVRLTGQLKQVEAERAQEREICAAHFAAERAVATKKRDAYNAARRAKRAAKSAPTAPVKTTPAKKTASKKTVKA